MKRIPVGSIILSCFCVTSQAQTSEQLVAYRASIVISAPDAGNYKIFVTHAGGTSGGQTPSDQTVSITTSGDTPAEMKIVEFEHSPTNETFLLSVKSDPGAHMQLVSCTDLITGAWQTNATFVTVGNTNSMFISSSSEQRFWRIRRETGISE